MRLRVRDIIEREGGVIPFSAGLDLTGLEINRQFPLPRPATFVGEVRNTAGLLRLHGTLSVQLCWVCDRCALPFVRDLTLPVELTLAASLEDAENDEIYLLDHDDEVDLSEVASVALLLDTGMKVLCREDCRGLCHRCGADLNAGLCSCEAREIDPQLSGLSPLLPKE